MLDLNEEGPEFHSVVTPPAASVNELPQFATAEYAHIPGSERCQICGNLIPGDYYRINGRMACTVCANQAMAGQPKDSHVAFIRSLLFGIGAAILGMIAYSAFSIITGWTIGYLALGVGWLVAKAMIKGSSGLGGRRYQITAVLLTYIAISLSAVPIGISYAMKHESAQAGKNSATAEESGTGSEARDEGSADRSKSRSGLGAMVGQLFLYGIASPFLELKQPAQGAIGLFILFIGLRIAWQLMRAKTLGVDGPYGPGA
jgi:hypothetical protein